MKPPLPENEAARLEALCECEIVDVDLERTTIERQRTQKHKSRFFTRIAAGFGLASAILVVIGVVSYRSLTGLVETSNQVAQSNKVVEKLEAVLSHMKDAETGQRGYVLTGQEPYLEPYHAAIEVVDQKVKDLRRLTAANPNQQRQLDTLELLIARRLAMSKQIIDLRKNKGFEAARQVVLTGKEKNLMDRIRSDVREMENHENVLLTRSLISVEASTRNTIVTFSSGIFLTFFILAGVYCLILRENTERKRTQAALQQERDFTSAVLDTASALVVVFDPQARIVRFNQACEQTTGYSFDEVKGKYVWDLFLMPEKVEAFQADFQKLLFREGSANEIGEKCQLAKQHENYWVMRDGDRRLIAWSNTLMSDKVGAVEYVIASGIDITERKQVEEQVRLLQTLMLAIGETQEFDEALAVILRTVCETKGWNYGEAWIPCPNESLLRCSSAWYSRADGSGRTLTVLEKFRKLSEDLTFELGIGLPGRVWSSQLPEWQEDVSRESQINFLRAQMAMECGLKAGLGIPLIVNEQVLAVLVFFKFESSKEDIRLVESISAVATQLGAVIQRKRMEEVLRESEERFKAFMNNSPAAAFMKDSEGRYVYVNEQCERSFHINLADWLGKTDFDLWPEEIALQLRENDTRVLSADKTVEILETIPTPDGGVSYWLSFKFPCLDVSGRRLLGGVAIDITERSTAESALLESKNRLSLINSISTGITSGMSVEQVIERTVKQISGYFNTVRVAYSTIDAGGILSVLHSIEPPKMAQLTGSVADLTAAPEYLNALRVSELFIVEDVATDSRLAPLADVMKAGDTQAVLDVPLQHSERLVGLLCFDSPEPRKWNEHEIVTLSEVADYLSVAIKEANAQLERQQAEEMLRRAHDELELRVSERTEELATALKTLQAAITQRQQVEEFNKRIIDSSNDCIKVLDLEGKVLFINVGGEKLLELNDIKYFQNRLWTDFWEGSNKEGALEAIRAAKAGGIGTFQGYCPTAAGTPKWWEVAITPIADADGKVERLLCVSHDVTQRLQAEEELKRAHDKLETRVEERTEELSKAKVALEIEIAERQQAESALSQANEKLTDWVNKLEQRNREIALLGEISDVLQACLTVEEAYTAIANLVQPLFPETSGGIFLITASKNLVEAVATWGEPPFGSQKLFTPNECWALRRGQAHWVDDLQGGLVCKHIHHDELLTESLCVPMMAQGEALGVLYLTSQKWGRLTETKQQLAVTVAEHIALSLANLKLREMLKSQSIRDPLTDLFNRRYLEESLEREVNRAQRKQQSLGIIMIDVDHFKRFNDTFGHEAGDAVLRELGQFLQRHVRKSDIACRYGGEELILILPEASLEITHQRAEQIRQGIKHVQVQHRHQQLDAITLSLGVACFPEHGITGEAVMQAADAALYRAKKEGRDAVRLAS